MFRSGHAGRSITRQGRSGRCRALDLRSDRACR
jgi:hypothetical protein